MLNRCAICKRIIWSEKDTVTYEGLGKYELITKACHERCVDNATEIWDLVDGAEKRYTKLEKGGKKK